MNAPTVFTDLSVAIADLELAARAAGYPDIAELAQVLRRGHALASKGFGYTADDAETLEQYADDFREAADRVAAQFDGVANEIWRAR